MAREVAIGSTVIDQFAAFEDDGYTTRSGLGSSDFTTKLFDDSTVSASPVTITEIGATGNYRVEFTPASGGMYEVQIAILFSKEIWHGQYVAVQNLTNAVVDTLGSSFTGVVNAISQVHADVSRVLGLLHRNSILDLQHFDNNQQLLSARLRVFDSPINVPSVPDGNEVTGLIQVYSIAATYTGINTPAKFSIVQVL